MSHEEIDRICKSALEKFGEKSQLIQMVEELNELSVEILLTYLCKYPSSKTDDMVEMMYQNCCDNIKSAKILNNKQLKEFNRKHTKDGLVDELADVLIMINQMMINFKDIDEDVCERIVFKTAKLRQRIEGDFEDHGDCNE